MDAKTSRFVLQVRLFRLPGGKQNATAPKAKTILITPQTVWRGINLQTLKPGSDIEAIGPDGGSGQELTARTVQSR